MFLPLAVGELTQQRLRGSCRAGGKKRDTHFLLTSYLLVTQHVIVTSLLTIKLKREKKKRSTLTPPTLAPLPSPLHNFLPRAPGAILMNFPLKWEMTALHCSVVSILARGRMREQWHIIRQRHWSHFDFLPHSLDPQVFVLLRFCLRQHKDTATLVCVPITRGNKSLTNTPAECKTGVREGMFK